MAKGHRDTFGIGLSTKGSRAFSSARLWQGKDPKRGIACEFGAEAAFSGGFATLSGHACALLLSQDSLLNTHSRTSSAERGVGGETVTGYYFHPCNVAETEVEALSHTQIML